MDKKITHVLLGRANITSHRHGFKEGRKLWSVVIPGEEFMGCVGESAMRILVGNEGESIMESA